MRARSAGQRLAAFLMAGLALPALLRQHGIERAAPKQYDADGAGEPA